jgi:hypothetical protein
MKKYLLSFSALFSAVFLMASPGSTSQFIKTDQFGYQVNGQKIAVISDPQVGYNSALSFTPGTTMQLRNWITDAVVFSGPVTSWNGGATHTQSGDKAFWFDFSAFTTAGSYYVFDPTNNVGSYRFEISDCVYNNVLKGAMRMFYYQRSGFAKQLPFADTGYVDAASHVGPQQDPDCRLYNNTSATTSKNLSGGWFDAGDYNKYVNFTWGTLTDLLLAYEQNPTVWADDYNLPESGNGIPDLLDETKVELDWLLKMQNSDGSVLCVVGGGGASPPSADVAARRYGPATTSASYTAASVFALAAIEYNAAGVTSYGSALQAAAINAWNWASANAGITFYNAGTLAAGEQEVDAYGTFSRQLASAVYLYALTGGSTYKSFVDANYSSMHLLQWTFAYPFEGTEQDALLYYAKTTGATVSVKNAIKTAYTSSLKTNNADNLPSYTAQTDAYRAFLADNNYTWNSNQTKSKQAIMFLNMNAYGMDAGNALNYKNAASGFVHYFHGVNPNSKTYLSNMSKYGAENSVTSFYHSWFTDGSALWDEVGISTYGPAPGFMPGGVNPTYDWDGCCPSGCGSPANNALCYSETIDPPKNQPIQKSWKDFNTSWPINSWTITEAGIYTQAAYARLLSNFCSTSACVSTGIHDNGDIRSGLVEMIYPQPAKDQLVIKLYGKENKMISYRLYDIGGRELLSGKQAASAEATVDVQLPVLPGGIYFVKVISESKSEVRKIVIE